MNEQSHCSAHHHSSSNGCGGGSQTTSKKAAKRDKSVEVEGVAAVSEVKEDVSVAGDA